MPVVSNSRPDHRNQVIAFPRLPQLAQFAPQAPDLAAQAAAPTTSIAAQSASALEWLNWGEGTWETLCGLSCTSGSRRGEAGESGTDVGLASSGPANAVHMCSCRPLAAARTTPPGWMFAGTRRSCPTLESHLHLPGGERCSAGPGRRRRQQQRHVVPRALPL